MAEFRIKVIIPEDSSFSVRGISARIYVSPSMSTIKELQNHISAYLRIADNFHLSLRGDILHPMTNVRVLESGDVVTIIGEGSFEKHLPEKRTIFDRIKKAFLIFTDFMAFLFDSSWKPNRGVCFEENNELPPNLSRSDAEVLDSLIQESVHSNYVVKSLQTPRVRKFKKPNRSAEKPIVEKPEKKNLTRAEALIEEISNKEFPVYY